MEGVSRSWYKKPACLVGLIVLILLGAGMSSFAYQVWHYLGLLKAGQTDPLATELKQKEIAKLFDRAASRVKPEVVEIPSQPTPTLGNPAAKVHLVEFVDFSCPFCHQEVPVIKAFMQRHASDIYFIFRDYPLTDIHPDASREAIAARCVFLNAGTTPAEKNATFWKYHDRLFSTQGLHTDAELRRYAQQANIDIARYDACLTDTAIPVAIEKSLAAGQAADVQGTPTFFFNGVRMGGAIDDEALELAFKEALKRAK